MPPRDAIDDLINFAAVVLPLIAMGLWLLFASQ